ncbi:MAG: shikimate kinase [Ignavibacteriae bacterium]|nr:shikimate kinase [Ignavibacteriota bacterium]
MDALNLRKARIYLTGFMGSGKSTIGPILANTIGYDFVDVDRTIEQETGMSVNEIFQELGGERFREMERKLVIELSNKSNLVVSLGGGTMVDPENYRAISSSGIIVYLKTNPALLFKRLHRKTDRPVLTKIPGHLLEEEELRARIEELYRTREPIYAKADITIQTDEKRVGITVDEVVKKLSQYLA